MTLAELVIKLSADTASLREDFDKAGKMALQAGDAIKSAFAGLTVGAIGAEIQHLATTFADAAAEIGKAARITGMSAEQLSGLRIIAKETDSDFATLTNTFAKAGKNIEEGFITPSSAAGKVLNSLFSTAELATLKMEPAGQRIQDVSKKIFALSDAGERSYAAAAIFGRGWTDASAVLQKLGSEGLDPAMERAAEFHQLFGDQDVKAAKDFKVSLEGLKSSFEGLEVTIGSRVVRPLSELFGLLAGNKMMVAEFTDELKLLSIGLGAQVASMTNFFGMNNAALDAMAKQATDIATHQHAMLQQFHAEMAAIANLGKPVAGVDLNIPSKPAKGKTAKSEGLTIDMPDEEDNSNLEDYYKKLIEFARAQFAALDPLAKFEKEISQLNDALKIGVITSGEYDQILTHLVTEQLGKAPKALPIGQQMNLPALAPQLTVVSDKFKALRADAHNFGETMSSSFTQMIVLGRGFESSMTSLLRLFEEFLIKTLVFKEIASAFSSVGGGAGGAGGGGLISGVGGVLGSFFKGLAGMAAGGPVTADQMYMVGENGPELFAPGTSGSIIPNDGFGGGGGGNTVHIDARGAQPGVEHLIVRAMQQAQKQASAQALVATYEYHARGGTL